ncbi:MAG: diacylglycerol kinase family protein [Erysipelothrix sp.]|nr:diacylglycerol kinase family protein [Erysipelothrix sp.]
MKLRHELQKKFEASFNGLKIVLTQDKSVKGHFVIASLVIIFFLWQEVTLTDWMVILIAIGLVICLEMINSSIEELADFLQPTEHEAIKRVKDVAAGAVLFASLIALVVGILMIIKYGGIQL